VSAPRRPNYACAPPTSAPHGAVVAAGRRPSARRTRTPWPLRGLPPTAHSPPPESKPATSTRCSGARAGHRSPRARASRSSPRRW